MLELAFKTLPKIFPTILLLDSLILSYTLGMIELLLLLMGLLLLLVLFIKVALEI